MNVNWNYPTSVAVGAGRIKELPEACASMGASAPLLVTDPGVSRLPLYHRIVELCQSAGLGVRSFYDIKANPTGRNVDDGIVAYRNGEHDCVIAIGGGSALDTGKAIALMAGQTCSLWDLEDVGDNWQRARTEGIAPVIAVPTTAGTGSEVGRASLLVNETEQRKVIIFHPNMMPTKVILDPELTLGLPPDLTAATGLDAMSHCLEAYCSPLYHPMAEGIAIEGIRLVKENLPAAVTNGSDIDARLQMLVASTMGATAFQRGLGAMHALAHPLGAVYDAHHGLLNAVLMPYVLVANRSVISDRIGRLARHLELPATFDGFLSWVLDLRESTGIPNTLAPVIEEDERFAGIGAMAHGDPSAGTNPVPFSVSDYQRIAGNALSGIL